MAFASPDRDEYDPNIQEPIELSPQQQHDFWTGLVKFLNPSNPAWIKLHLRARSGDTVRGTPAQATLDNLPKRPGGYDPTRHD